MKVKEEKFRVRTFECQADGSISIFSLMQYLSEVFEADEVDIAVASDPNAKFHVLASKAGADAAVYLMEVVC